MATKKAKTVSEMDRIQLNRIRRAINDPSHYGKTVEGIHTWDVTKIFEDFRTTIQIARRAIKRAEAANL